ncbi:unnamed protein product [Camellia sinensis]
MVFDHRKLMSDSSDTNILDFCESCNATKNLDGICRPIACISQCFSICSPTLIIVIPPPDPPTTNHQSQKTHNLHLLLIISLSILSTIFLIFCLYTIFKYYKRWDISRRRRSSSQAQQQETHDDFFDEDHGPMVDHPIWYIRTVGLQPSIINSITVCKYKRGDGLIEGTDCSVCLSEFEEDETLRLLPKCNHAFHIPCIDTWLRSHTNCPMCRAGIVSNTTVLPVPVPEGSVDDSVLGEEVEVISESSGEFRREREDGDCDLRMGMEEDGETRVENGEEGGEISMEEVQPTRRSVSMDSFSASMISAAIANAQSRESTQLAKVNQSNMAIIVPKKENVNQSLARLVGGSSIGRSLQKGPTSIKRSLSCSGKVFLSRYTRSQSRSRSTVLPS